VVCVCRYRACLGEAGVFSGHERAKGAKRAEMEAVCSQRCFGGKLSLCGCYLCCWGCWVLCQMQAGQSVAEEGILRLGKIEIRTCTGAGERKMACWRRHGSSRVADKGLRAQANVCVGWMCALRNYVMQPRGAGERRKS